MVFKGTGITLPYFVMTNALESGLYSINISVNGQYERFMFEGIH